MRLPNFLVIGAMRAGTTTLYRHLELHPEIFLPQTKEPESFCSDDILTEAGRRTYAGLFQPAKPQHRLIGEASTAYTKLPDYGDVIGRLTTVLGTELKLVYIVRHPVERIRSQHHHYTANGVTNRPLNEAVRDESRYVNYSRYAMQLQPYIERFGAERLKVVRFENYVADTPFWYAEICRFLGLDPAAAAPLPEQVFNAAAGRPSATKTWQRLVFSQPWYQVHVRPRIPRGLREKLAQTILPKAADSDERLTADTRALLWERLGPDVERFEAMMAGPFHNAADKRVYRVGS